MAAWCKGIAVTLLLLLSFKAGADELRPAYLQLTEVRQDVFSVLWKVPANGQARLALTVDLGGGPGESPEKLSGFVSGTYVETWELAVDGGLAGRKISINGLPRTSTDVLMRIEYRDGVTITNRFTPASPEYTVATKPTLVDTAYTYLVLGVEHILLGIDHLLFVLALLLLVDQTRKLVITITFFTLAHSITLSLASLDLIHVPVPPVEAIIALSIVFVASEILRVQAGHSSLTHQKPWVVAFTFGLLHGLGFAAALGEIGLPQTAVPLALLFFNVGVEIGQLIFVFAYLLIASLISNVHVLNTPALRKVPPYVIGSLASFWVIERTAGFWG